MKLVIEACQSRHEQPLCSVLCTPAPHICTDAPSALCTNPHSRARCARHPHQVPHAPLTRLQAKADSACDFIPAKEKDSVDTGGDDCVCCTGGHICRPGQPGCGA